MKKVFYKKFYILFFIINDIYGENGIINYTLPSKKKISDKTHEIILYNSVEEAIKGENIHKSPYMYNCFWRTDRLTLLPMPYPFDSLLIPSTIDLLSDTILTIIFYLSFWFCTIIHEFGFITNKIFYLYGLCFILETLFYGFELIKRWFFFENKIIVLKYYGFFRFYNNKELIKTKKLKVFNMTVFVLLFWLKISFLLASIYACYLSNYYLIMILLIMHILFFISKTIIIKKKIQTILKKYPIEVFQKNNLEHDKYIVLKNDNESMIVEI